MIRKLRILWWYIRHNEIVVIVRPRPNAAPHPDEPEQEPYWNG